MFLLCCLADIHEDLQGMQWQHHEGQAEGLPLVCFLLQSSVVLNQGEWLQPGSSGRRIHYRRCAQSVSCKCQPNMVPLFTAHSRHASSKSLDHCLPPFFLATQQCNLICGMSLCGHLCAQTAHISYLGQCLQFSIFCISLSSPLQLDWPSRDSPISHPEAGRWLSRCCGGITASAHVF